MSEDDLLYLKGKGVRALVRMAETDRARVTATQIEEVGFTDCHQPVADFTAPTQDQISQMIAFVEESLARGRPVGISCGAGIGRTGTILACSPKRVRHSCGPVSQPMIFLPGLSSFP